LASGIFFAFSAAMTKSDLSKTTMALETPLRDRLDSLAAFEPFPDGPVLSVYLDLRPDQNGRPTYDSFLRKAFSERARTLKGEARQSFDRDVERITHHLGAAIPKSASAVAIFACAARDDFFEAIRLDAPIEQHWLFIGSVPHLYPLARVNDQFPRYAALLVDTNSARLFVFGLNATETRREVRNVKTRKSSMGGWSQARYQRHLENFHLHHMKEVVDVLDRVVRAESINQVIVACDEVSRPVLMEQLPKHLAEKVVDVLKLDINTPRHEVLAETLDALRERDAKSDAQAVGRMLDAWQAGGLAVVGPEDTLSALTLGQVEELLVTASPDRLKKTRGLPADAAPGPVDVETSAQGPSIDADRVKLADELVTRAQQSSARIRFIEDPGLLADVGGVGALLRFKI
jgi:peptide chain release factor subunit 1